MLSSSSTLREIDLSNNDLLDNGVDLLSAGLASKDSILETLRSVSRCTDNWLEFKIMLFYFVKNIKYNNHSSSSLG